MEKPISIDLISTQKPEEPLIFLLIENETVSLASSEILEAAL